AARSLAARASKEPEVGRSVAAQALQVDLDALDTSALGEHASLGLDARRDEEPVRRRERGVEVESLLIAEQLLDAGDLADPLHLDHHGATLAVPAQQIDRTDVGRVLTPHDAEVVPKGAHARGDELLQLDFDAVFGEAGVIAQRDVVVEQ